MNDSRLPFVNKQCLSYQSIGYLPSSDGVEIDVRAKEIAPHPNRQYRYYLLLRYPSAESMETALEEVVGDPRVNACTALACVLDESGKLDVRSSIASASASIRTLYHIDLDIRNILSLIDQFKQSTSSIISRPSL